MSNDNEPFSNKFKTPANRGMVGGVALILLGLFMLLGQWIDTPGVLFLPILGLAFLAWGYLSRAAGLMIPGGILTGIGAGSALLETLFRSAPEDTRGGIFLLVFAAGWALITLASMTIGQRMTWPLIPAGIIGLIGAALLVGGPLLQALDWLGVGWPLILIAVGVFLLFKRPRA